jgi:hypothetical protein
MASYSEIAQSLTESLELTQPVAVCLTDSVPAGVEHYCSIPQAANIRRKDVEAGGHPTIEESLMALQIAG